VLLTSLSNVDIFETITIASATQANRICIDSIGGTFLTTRNAIQNFGFLWPGTASLFIGSIIDWMWLSIAGLIFSLYYFRWYRKALLRLETLNPEDYFFVESEETEKEKAE